MSGQIIGPIGVLPSAVVPYVGPGDVISGAASYWGLRGYNAAYATGSNPGIDVVDTATGATQTTINILSTGKLDTATITGLGYAVSVKKIYDQVAANHLTQATLALMPALTLNAIGTLPGMTFTGTQHLDIASYGVTLVQPFSTSMVAKRTGSFTNFQAVLGSSTGASQFGFNNSADQILLYNGAVASAGATDGSFHAVQFLSNIPSISAIYVDGSNTTGLNSSGSGFDTSVAIGLSGGNGFVGVALEAMVWSGDKTASNSAINSNQHAYWGF